MPRSHRPSGRVSPLVQGPAITRRSAVAGLMAGVVTLPLRPAPALAQDTGTATADTDGIIRAHGYSFYGNLSYPPDFAHFDYVNPDAPRGGEISVRAAGTFDSMNPYARKGRAGRLSWMLYESLLGQSPATGEPLPADAYDEMYGLLAEGLEYDVAKTWVVFHLRGDARFADGAGVTAEDVIHTHNLFLDQGLRSYAEAVRRRVPGAEVIDERTVKFRFAEGISRRSLIDQVGSTPVMPRHWFEETGQRLDEPALDFAPGSGPYRVESREVNRSIVYARNPDYWGWHLPINTGRHNFDRIRVEYFADDNAAFEAFKAGIYTFRPEGNSKTWATGYDFSAVDKGYVMREEIPDGMPPTPTGFVFNLDRPKFQDKRVRKAVSLAFNFEWTNQSLQYGLFKQRHSFVQDTHLQAQGAPEGGELAFLKSLGDAVPPELLSEPAVRAHSSDPDRQNDRRNLRRAMRLLDKAGWTVGEDGMRRNADGKRLSIEIPIASSSAATMGAIVEGYVNNLRIIGIDARYQQIDPSQYTMRSRERDYDMVFDNYVSFLEAGTGLMQRYGSREAEFSLFNPAGLASPLVDAIIERALETDTRAAQDVALTALDRALRFERFMIPVWYNDSHWVAYWDMFARPDPLPRYALGVLDFWWFDRDKAARLKAAGAL